MRLPALLAISLSVCDPTPEPTAEASAPEHAPDGKKTVGAAEPEPQPEPEPVTPELPGFQAALARAIQMEDGIAVIDPFVATLVAEHLAETGGKPTFVWVNKRAQKKGVPKGWRVKPLEEGSLFHRLGFRKGDIVIRIGDAQPPGHKRINKQLKTVGSDLEVGIIRDGEEYTLWFALDGDRSWHGYLEEAVGRTFDDPKPEPAEIARAGGSGGGGSPRVGGKPASGGKSVSGGGGSSSGSIPVSCSSNSSCTVAKWYFDKMVSSSSAVRKQAKISAASGGYKLTWVKPGSGVHKLRFRSGDVISRVNGRHLSNQLEALALYAGLKSTRTYKVNYTRGGKSLTKTIRVK